MRDAAVVAGRRHAIMFAQGVVACGQVRTGIGIKVAKRGRQTVAAVFARRAAQHPKRVLQPLSQCDIALAAQDDMGMFEA